MPSLPSCGQPGGEPIKLGALPRLGAGFRLQLRRHELCDLRQVSSPLWAFITSLIKLEA